MILFFLGKREEVGTHTSAVTQQEEQQEQHEQQTKQQHRGKKEPEEEQQRRGCRRGCSSRGDACGAEADGGEAPPNRRPETTKEKD